MLQNVGVNTEKTDIRSQAEGSRKTPSIKLKERNIKHTRINSIKDLQGIYVCGEILGRGVFGTVMEITDKTTKKIWALKIVDKKMAKGKKIHILENEIRILKMVNHPHIIYLDRTFESQKNIYLVIERCTTELAILLRQKKKFADAEVRKVMDHLSNATAYLHKYEIVHRDLKMENILTAPNPNDPSDELYIKVSDFGLAIVKSVNRPDQMLSDRCGTLAYMAPEIISRASYSQQCDVWAMGVICYLLVTGMFPFYSKNENDLVQIIVNNEPNYNNFKKTDTDLVHLLSKMLEKNPALRISAAEVCRHPWIRGEEIDHSTYNVLDMMQLWRSEMMVESPNEARSDWANAFSNLQLQMESTTKLNPNLLMETIPNLVEQDPANPLEPPIIQEDPTAVKAANIKIEKKVVTKSKNKSGIKSITTATPIVRTVDMTTSTECVDNRDLNVKDKNSTKLVRIGKINRDYARKKMSF